MKNYIPLVLLVLASAACGSSRHRYYDRANALDRMPEAMKSEDVGDFSAFMDTCLKAWGQSGAQCQQFWLDFVADRQRRHDPLEAMRNVRPDLSHMVPYRLTQEDVEDVLHKIEVRQFELENGQN